MSVVEKHLSKVGRISHDRMKVALFQVLLSRYRPAYGEDFAEYLAAAVANHLFSDEASEGGKAFATANDALIKAKARELSKEDALCRALTCAVYNYCYGKYVESGRKVGLLFHPFLGYVRMFQRVVHGKESARALDSSDVGPENILPLVNLLALGLYRDLPFTPDSKLMLDEVVSFEKSIPAAVTREIETLAGSGPSVSPEPVQSGSYSNSRNASTIDSPLKDGFQFLPAYEHPEFHADGRATVRAHTPAGPLSFLRQSVQIMRRRLKPEEKQVFERWLGITDGQWTQAHEDAFVRGFERFLYEGESKDESLRGVKDMARTEYPILSGSAIDIPFPDYVRRAYSKLMGGRIV